MGQKRAKTWRRAGRD